LLQSFGHGISSWQDAPVQPSRQLQVPSMHTPLPLQSAGSQGTTSVQLAPRHPALQIQTPSWQCPFSEQPSLHGMGMAQSSPMKPGAHMHRPLKHRPFPLHMDVVLSIGLVTIPGHVTGSEQSRPWKPRSHWHLPLLQKPLREHSFSH
jgi:hypothetical protein